MNEPKARILCVDDEPHNLSLLEAILFPLGYVVVTAVNGPEALEKIRTERIDICLLDVMMPGMDGFEVCRRIKSDVLYRNIPVVMITAFADMVNRILGIEAGAEDFISNPFNSAEVLARIKMLLQVKSLNDQLQSAYTDVARLNTDLAARAAELEAANVELEAVNMELEAFNYTVAHDLRNPLNVISSYCQVFKELCGDKLDEQCMHYIQETYNGTLRMNRLIEALLDFSRMAHAELNRAGIDLGSIAKEVAEELKGTGDARRVEIRIADGIVANGDANLLRVVLANLLGNAWKYTATREEQALIEFGTTEIDGKPVYFVRDNGAGFDNADADKLFVPFQRLPGAEEYRGFGIGLATVDRIIRRHGGKVWAEGEPGKGATFYFTLPADKV